MKIYRFSCWAPVYAEVEVKATTYGAAIILARMKARTMSMDEFDLVVDRNEIEVQLEDLNGNEP